MNRILESVYQHPKNLSTFRSGTTWFIGVTARKHAELLDQLVPLAESGNLDAKSLETTVQTFLDWFREKYYQAQQQECTYDDSEIVESVGVLLIDETGKIKVEVVGRFQFWTIKKGQINAVTNQIQETDSIFVVADPKHTDVARPVKDVLSQTTGDELSGRLAEIAYPFAVLKTSRHEKSFLRNRYAVIGLALCVLVGTGWGLWQKREIIWQGSVPEVVEPKPTRNKPVDTFATDRSSIAKAETLIYENRKSPAETKIIHNSSPNRTSNQPIAKKNESETNRTADHYYDAAERSLSFARASIADGKNKKALAQLETSIYNYQQYLVRKPEMKALIQPKLKEIRQKRNLIENDAL